MSTALLRAALNALNQIPNRRLNIDGHKDTYALAAAINKELGEALYDPVDAAYIARGLFKWMDADRANRLLGGGEGGQLEEMSAAWIRAIAGATAITEAIHPDEWDRLSVFAYEHLDHDSPLVVGLRDLNRTARSVVQDWCRENGVKMR